VHITVSTGEPLNDLDSIRLEFYVIAARTTHTLSSVNMADARSWGGGGGDASVTLQKCTASVQAPTHHDV
jgi:hypothetical protein